MHLQAGATEAPVDWSRFRHCIVIGSWIVTNHGTTDAERTNRLHVWAREVTVVQLSDLPWEGHDKHEFIGDKTLCYETEGGARVPMAVFMLGRLKLCKT